MAYHAQGFVDGGYLREVAKIEGKDYIDPLKVVEAVLGSEEIMSWPLITRLNSAYHMGLTRVTYYDGRPAADAEADAGLLAYWNAIELLPGTQLGFGSLRGRDRRTGQPRQKGVDTLIAVDMLVGAFTNLFTVAVLVAGDADFVPVIHEVKRRGVMVVVAGYEGSSPSAVVSEDLKRAADRYYVLKPQQLNPLKV